MLDISNNQLRDEAFFSSLSCLPKLRCIISNGNEYQAICLSAPLPKLKEVSLDDNQISSFSVTAALPSLRLLSLKYFTSVFCLLIECISVYFVRENMLRCMCGLAQLRGLTELFLDDNRFEEVSEGTLGGIAAAEELCVLSIKNNPVQSVSSTDGILRIPNLLVDTRFLKTKERGIGNRRTSEGAFVCAESKPP